jgi:UDP-3-O-[3-hydroxymyristoyl] glucosamine N-acyltransferase
VLLEPLEEQLNLPSVLVEISNFESGKMECIRQKCEVSVLLVIVKSHKSQPLRKLLLCVHIREFVSIGAGAVIGERVLLMAGAVVEAGAVIGDDCVLHPRVVVHHGCVVGARCILHAGAVIGADGFGNAWAGDHWEKIPQIGRAVLGDDVEIGANTTIDRGALADTVIERGVRLDNLIHIAHNCRVGAHTAMAACVGVAGSTSIGANCMIGGAAMISGHLKIGDRVHISGGTLVAKNLDKPGQYTAVYPLATHKEWLGNAAHVRQLGKLAARVKQLEARLAAANATDPHSTKEPQ